MTDLHRHWPAVVADRPDLRDRLLEAYDAPGRHYHDTRHLAEVLGHLERLLARTDLPQDARDAVVLAAWFHDAVYDGRPDDEERSAVLAKDTLAGAVPPRLVDEVVRLVRVTQDHRPAADDLAGKLLCDADLAVLAADDQRYEEYTRAVREEYAHVDDQAFRAGRAAVLQGLLQDRLFRSPAVPAEWEERARANVRAELARLSPPGSP